MVVMSEVEAAVKKAEQVGRPDAAEKGLVREVVREEVVGVLEDWVLNEYGPRLKRRADNEITGVKISRGSIQRSLVDEELLIWAAGTLPGEWLKGRFEKAMAEVMIKAGERGQAEVAGWIGELTAIQILRAAFVDVEEMSIKDVVSAPIEDINQATDIRVGNALVQVKAVYGLDEVVFDKLEEQHEQSGFRGTVNGKPRLFVDARSVQKIRGAAGRYRKEAGARAFVLLVPRATAEDPRFSARDGAEWYRGMMTPEAMEAAVEAVLNNEEATDAFMAAAGIE